MQGILLTTEKAFDQFISASVVANGVSVKTYTGFDNETYQCPKVVSFAESAEEDFPEGGVWKVNLGVSVKENLDETNITTSELSDFIFRSILEADKSTIANMTSGYAIYSILSDGMSNTIENNLYTQTLNLSVMCVLTS